VGIGILPAVARNPAVTAMEIATLCGLAPGRVLPGIGHGVQAWMQQMGVRPTSPLATLEEVLVAVRRLLDGDRVTMHGRLRALPFFDDLVTRLDSHGVGGLAAMPSDWWTEIGPIGTVDDAVTHIEALEAAGVHSIGLFPAPDVSIATAQLDDVLRLGTR
jgi:alkanesulfonate monooxygenase SsuD/methylene tetrahydromethanopterin reductase-like flavin-dependent oxidoreductase (luciferase family)